MNVEKVSEYIINWLKDYATNAGVKGFVIGVSGGIDSALTSTLCAKTGLPTLVRSTSNVASIILLSNCKFPIASRLPNRTLRTRH